MARRSTAERVDLVLRSAWDGDQAAAERILARWPEIGAHDIYIAAATANSAEVERRLAAESGAATRKGGPLDWEPLLYVAYARLPGRERHALALARALLDHGANPNAEFDDGWGNPFKVLTGVIGHGEGDKPPHPLAHELPCCWSSVGPILTTRRRSTTPPSPMTIRPGSTSFGRSPSGETAW